MRDDLDTIKHYNLFTKSNCKIPSKDKTYERFTDELNKAMNKYDISTCLRKIYFLAQIYVESDQLLPTKEYGAKLSYDPYRGRGLIQLTHSGEVAGTIGYKQYFEYLGRTDYKTKYEDVAQDLVLAVDSAGYFWKRGKLLNKGEFLTSSYKHNGINPKYSKTKLASHTTIDINIVADDNVKQVSYLVNGSENHLQQRINLTAKLKGILKYDECVNKK